MPVTSIACKSLAFLSRIPDRSRRLARHGLESRLRPGALLGVGPDGSPALALNDKEGKLRVGLDVMSDGSAVLGLNDKEGKQRVALVVNADGRPLLGLNDKEGKQRAALSLNPDSSQPGEPSSCRHDLLPP